MTKALKIRNQVADIVSNYHQIIRTVDETNVWQLAKRSSVICTQNGTFYLFIASYFQQLCSPNCSSRQKRDHFLVS